MDLEQCVGSKDFVNAILVAMKQSIEWYGCVTVADYHDLIGRSPMYKEVKFGWISVAEATINSVDNQDTYELILPKPLPIA